MYSAGHKRQKKKKDESSPSSLHLQPVHKGETKRLFSFFFFSFTLLDLFPLFTSFLYHSPSLRFLTDAAPYRYFVKTLLTDAGQEGNANETDVGKVAEVGAVDDVTSQREQDLCERESVHYPQHQVQSHDALFARRHKERT